MAQLFGGLKQSLKLDEKLNAAKEYAREKQQSVSEIGAIKSIKEKTAAVAASATSSIGSATSGWQFSPAAWSKHFPSAGGKKQSPIDIQQEAVQFDEQLQATEFRFNYNPKDIYEVANLGITFQMTCADTTQSTFSAPPLLPDTFKLSQAHLHWGAESHNGSEHTIAGFGYAAELHLVHINTKYPTADEAAKHPDGLAVVSILLAEGVDNPVFDPVIRSLDKILFKGDRVSLSGIDLRRLLPDKLDFWTYEGSLTTPPCTECVIWVVFKSTSAISATQLSAFRKLYAVGVEDAERNPQNIRSNVRPTQPLNGRIIRSNFK